MSKLSFFQTLFIFVNPRIKICFTQILQTVYKIIFFDILINFNYNAITSWRTTNLVLIGNFCAASNNASFATASVTPSASNSIRPGSTTAAQYSGLPFTFTHSHFLWFFSNRLIRKYPDPHISFTLHITGQCLTCSFQLAVSKPIPSRAFNP